MDQYYSYIIAIVLTHTAAIAISIFQQNNEKRLKCTILLHKLYLYILINIKQQYVTTTSNMTIGRGLSSQSLKMRQYSHRLNTQINELCATPN